MKKNFRDDWTFEDKMAGLNCTVHAHDPSVNYPSHRGARITFDKIGIGSQAGPGRKTLKQFVAGNREENKYIFYLKADIEVNTVGVPSSSRLKIGLMSPVQLSHKIRPLCTSD